MAYEVPQSYKDAETLVQSFMHTCKEMEDLAKSIYDNLEPESDPEGNYNDDAFGMTKDVKLLENHMDDAASLLDDLRSSLILHVQKSKGA
jgi:hypothetical protein